MGEVNFDGNRSCYRIRRNNSSEFPQENEFHNRHQRRPSFVRETCRTPDAYSSRNMFRIYDREPSSVNWSFSECNKSQTRCSCSASTPKIHQSPAGFDPRREAFLYSDRSHSPSPSIPSYYSLRADASKRKESNFSDSKTLGRQKSKNRSAQLSRSMWSPGQNVKNCQSERCLSWLQGSNEFGQTEKQLKELDMNIELLKWKKKHLEGIHLQKMQSLQQHGIEAPTGHHPESPPPLSDITKPDISVDDGFESVADACNNPLAQNLSELELELRKQKQKAKFFESMLGKYKSEVEGLKLDFKKQENRHHMEIEKMKNFYEKKKFEPDGLPERPSDGPGAQGGKARAVRPKSFKRELFPACRGGCEAQNSEIVVGLKAELIVKDQHLKKLRATLKELSSRHNELLDLHMMLVKSQSKSSGGDAPTSSSSSGPAASDPMRIIDDLRHVVEDVQKIFDSVGVPGGGGGGIAADACSPAVTPSADQLLKLQESVEKLKMEAKKRCPDESHHQ